MSNLWPRLTTHVELKWPPSHHTIPYHTDGASDSESFVRGESWSLLWEKNIFVVNPIREFNSFETDKLLKTLSSSSVILLYQALWVTSKKSAIYYYYIMSGCIFETVTYINIHVILTEKVSKLCLRLYFTVKILITTSVLHAEWCL